MFLIHVYNTRFFKANGKKLQSERLDYRLISIVSCVGKVYVGILRDALLWRTQSPKLPDLNMVLWLIDLLLLLWSRSLKVDMKHSITILQWTFLLCFFPCFWHNKTLPIVSFTSAHCKELAIVFEWQTAEGAVGFLWISSLCNTILHPLLFVICINSLDTHLPPSVIPVKYADDPRYLRVPDVVYLGWLRRLWTLWLNGVLGCQHQSPKHCRESTISVLLRSAGLTCGVLKQIYLTFIRPVLECASPVWGGPTKNLCEKPKYPASRIFWHTICCFLHWRRDGSTLHTLTARLMTVPWVLTWFAAYSLNILRLTLKMQN